MVDSDEKHLSRNIKDYSEENLREDKERIANLLRSAQARNYATYGYANIKRIILYRDSACHAPFVREMPKNIKVVGSCFNTTSVKYDDWCGCGSSDKTSDKFNEIGEKYWSWICGPESPWRTLFVNSLPERVENSEGELVGFFLDPEMVEAHKGHALNFCIATRQVGENRPSLKIWSDLVDHGMHPADAFYLCRMVSPSTEGLVMASGKTNDTGHWPLMSISYHKKGFCFDRFRNGNPDLKVERETLQWLDSSGIKKDFSFAGLPIEKEDRAMSTYYKLEKVIDHFMAWLDREGQIEKERIAA